MEQDCKNSVTAAGLSVCVCAIWCLHKHTYRMCLHACVHLMWLRALCLCVWLRACVGLQKGDRLIHLPSLLCRQA